MEEFNLNQNTILGQAIKEVLERYPEISNDMIELISDIYNGEYTLHETQYNNRYLKVTDIVLDIFLYDNIIKTNLIYEYSWLVQRMELIYKPFLTVKSKPVFYSTLANLINLINISESVEDDFEIFEEVAERIVIMFSSWLHPSHINNLRFKTPEIKFPTIPLDD